MIAMQYRFRLPADYDMDIIRTRIRSGGPQLDNFPGLLFKAFCYSEAEAGEPLYAPFYLWQNSAGMKHFLCSTGFQRLTRDFGWPQIDTWLVLHYQPPRGNTAPVYARRIVRAIPPYTELSQFSAEAEPTSDGHLRLEAWDVHHWRHLVFESASAPFLPQAHAECYRAGYLSLPAEFTP